MRKAALEGEYIRASGEDWQTGLQTQWTFNGEAIEGDSGTQSLVGGFTDVDHFECDGDELILQSLDGPPLALTRMIDMP